MSKVKKSTLFDCEQVENKPYFESSNKARSFSSSTSNTTLTLMASSSSSSSSSQSANKVSSSTNSIQEKKSIKKSNKKSNKASSSINSIQEKKSIKEKKKKSSKKRKASDDDDSFTSSPKNESKKKSSKKEKKSSKKRKASSDDDHDDDDDSKNESNKCNDELLQPHLPEFNGEKLTKCPPRSVSSPEEGLALAKAYLGYVQLLFDNYPHRFKNQAKRLKTWDNFKDLVKTDSFVYNESFRNFIKNFGHHIAKTTEQTERMNETERERSAKRRELGKCRCSKGVCEENRDKCKECSLKTAKQKKEKEAREKKEGRNCYLCNIPFKEDGTCSGCAELNCDRKIGAVNTFLKEVKQEPKVEIKCNRCNIGMGHRYHITAFSIHHDRYQEEDHQKTFSSTRGFTTSFNKRGAEWFRTEETLELLCRPCHALEHARSVEGNSTWKKTHDEMIKLLGGRCQCCGLCFEEVGLGKIFHVHHKDFDGKMRREEATEEMDEEDREVAMHVNEYKLILAMEGSELQEKLSTLELLCDGCHHFEHLGKHIKSEVLDLKLEEGIKNILSFQRVLLGHHDQM